MTDENPDSDKKCLHLLLRLWAEGHTLPEIKAALVRARERQALQGEE
jgi:hypothetical protein